MIAHQVIDGAAAAQAGPGARARILVIDDEQAIRSALSRALEAEGFKDRFRRDRFRRAQASASRRL
jgi:PleD family two-component response regulator